MGILFVVVGIILLSVLIFSLAKKFNWELYVTLPIIISIISLCIALLGTFKEVVFPFELKVLNDTVIIPFPRDNQGELPLIVPLSFVNMGYGDGVIEWVALKIVSESGEDIKLYGPIAEVNLEKLIQGKRNLHAENIEEGFSSFLLKSRESTKRHILFLQEIDNDKYPKSKWSEGKYQIHVFVKISSVNVAKEFITISLTVNKNNIIRQADSTTSYIMNRKLEID